MTWKTFCFVFKCNYIFDNHVVIATYESRWNHLKSYHKQSSCCTVWLWGQLQQGFSLVSLSGKPGNYLAVAEWSYHTKNTQHFTHVRKADLSFREARHHGNENSCSAILNFWPKQISKIKSDSNNYTFGNLNNGLIK